MFLQRVKDSLFLTTFSQMGLDIMCGSLGVKVGSYSGVQQQRVAWIKAESMRQDSLGNKEMATNMNTVICSRGIRYDFFTTIVDWLPGTRAFVDHSDCDGVWDCCEAKDILEAVKILKPFFSKDDADLYFETDGEYYLKGILSYSVRHHKDIVFC